MVDEVVKTQVDDLLELLKHTPKISLAEAAKKLNVSVDVLQSWVDFFVEENILGIEYSFTTPFIYLNKPIESNKKNVNIQKNEDFSIPYFKNIFWEKARTNNIPIEKVEMLWKNHLLQALELQKKYFVFEAQRRKFSKIDSLWEEYQTSILLS